MLKRKALIPMASIMLVSSSMSVFASDGEENKNNIDEYEELIYKTAKVDVNKGLNIRSTPKIEKNNKLYALPKGTELEILGQENDWYKVELNNDKSGWISSNYVEVNNKTLYVNVDRVNFREGSSLDSKVYEVLEQNTKVEFLEDKNDWIKVKYKDKEGYIYNKYVTDEKPVINNKEEVVQQSTKPQINNNNIQQNNKSEKTQKPEIDNNKPEQSIKPEIDNNKPEESQKPPVSNTNKQKAIVNLAYAQLGKPYVWGAEGPNSFDCSGLMTYIFKNGGGINLPRTSKQQSNFGTTVSKSELQPGDLIFSSTDGSGGVSHVGIYVGNGEMIHSPKPGDVVQKSKINTSYWNNTYLWAKRVI